MGHESEKDQRFFLDVHLMIVRYWWRLEIATGRPAVMRPFSFVPVDECAECPNTARLGGSVADLKRTRHSNISFNQVLDGTSSAASNKTERRTSHVNLCPVPAVPGVWRDESWE
jgi:hypothetical protein